MLRCDPTVKAGGLPDSSLDLASVRGLARDIPVLRAPSSALLPIRARSSLPGQQLLGPRAGLRRDRGEPLGAPRGARQRHLAAAEGVPRLEELAVGEKRVRHPEAIAGGAGLLLAEVSVRQPG